MRSDPDDPWPGFGARLADLRNLHGLTQEQFANAIGVTTQMVSRYESSKSRPREIILWKMASVLKVPVSELRDGLRENDGQAPYVAGQSLSEAIAGKFKGLREALAKVEADLQSLAR